MAEQRILKEIKATNMQFAAKEWVEKNRLRIGKLLLDERSLWESFVDWVHESPTGRWVLGAVGLLLGFIPAILVFVAYFLNYHTSKLVHFFCRGLPLWCQTKGETQKNADVEFALEHMSQSMRTKANEMLGEYTKYMENEDLEPSLAQKAYARIQGVLENMPDDSPVKQCFVKQDIPKKSDDALEFKGEWGAFKDSDEGEANSQKNAELIIAFIQKSFGIGELQLRSLTGHQSGIGYVFGHHYCMLHSMNLHTIIAVDSQTAVNKAKNFCEDLMNEKTNHENLGSSSVVSQPTSTAVNSYSEKDPPPQPLNDTIEYKKN